MRSQPLARSLNSSLTTPARGRDTAVGKVVAVSGAPCVVRVFKEARRARRTRRAHRAHRAWCAPSRKLVTETHGRGSPHVSPTCCLWRAVVAPPREPRQELPCDAGASQPVVAVRRQCPSVAARPTPDLRTVHGAGRPHRKVLTTHDQPTRRALCLLYCPRWSGNADSRGGVPLCANDIRPGRVLSAASAAAASVRSETQPLLGRCLRRRTHHLSPGDRATRRGFFSAPGADVIFASRPRAPVSQPGLN
jgi:hypothetical protein